MYTKAYFSIFLFLFSGFIPAQELKSLIAKYSLDKNDKKDNSLKYGTTFGEDRFGNLNSACHIHGNNGSFLNLGTDKRLKPKEGSISLWVKVEHLMLKGKGVESNPIIFTRSHSGEDYNEAYYVGYEMKNKNIGCCVSLSKLEQVSVYSGKEFSLNYWHHLVVTYDYSYFCLYIDGALEAKMIKNFDTYFLERDSIIIGNRISEKNYRFLNAYIDDVEIHNKALSASEVIQLFNSANPNKTKILVKAIGMIFIALIFILGIIWLIKRRISLILKREREKNEIMNKFYEQDNKVLKAQMNPHFIFNSLNAVQQFIISNENEKAEKYLSKFAKLMRQLLESNTKEHITLKEEIELIEKYLEIEALRFKNIFKYEISLEDGLNPTAICIPHFLIQPLVENAIWHGLLPKNGDKHLLLSFRKINSSTLLCSIEDNGVGRKARNNENKEKTSFALQFIQQRLALMSKIKKSKYELKITDKLHNNQSLGTIVSITTPIYDTI